VRKGEKREKFSLSTEIGEDLTLNTNFVDEDMMMFHGNKKKIQTNEIEKLYSHARTFIAA
jgi:hypothetical protein